MIDFDPKETLKRDIAAHLALHPEDGPELLQTVAEGLKRYQDTIQRSRNVEARLAVEGAVSALRFKRLGKEFHVLLRACYIMFPKGNPTTGSDNNKWAWNQFIQSIDDTAPSYVKYWASGDSEPEQQAKLTWWYECVLPEVAKKLSKTPSEKTP